MATRVLLAGLPGIMRDIVEHALAAEADMRVLGHVALDEGLAAVVREQGADVVVVGLDRREHAPRLDALLYECPRVTCLAIAGDARAAFLYELAPRAKPLGDISPNGLVAAIRSLQVAGAA